MAKAHHQRTLFALLLVISTFVTAGCGSSIDGEQYRQSAPALDIIDFFAGSTRAWGVVQDFSGNTVQRFTVDLQGTLSAADGQRVLTLDETFHYQLGEGMEKRLWILTETADGTIVGEADDIVGSATGTSYGNAFQFRYQMDLAVGDSSVRVAFDDWIWAFDERTIINRSYIKKWGITVAEVTIFMQKQDPRVTVQ